MSEHTKIDAWNFDDPLIEQEIDATMEPFATQRRLRLLISDYERELNSGTLSSEKAEELRHNLHIAQTALAQSLEEPEKP